MKQGGSYYIALPQKWFEAHGLNPEDLELLLVANRDIRIVNPDYEGEVYEAVSKITEGAEVR